jgi:hypothetical protein
MTVRRLGWLPAALLVAACGAASTAPASLELIASGDVVCDSIGGCAAYLGFQGLDPAGELQEWKLNAVVAGDDGSRVLTGWQAPPDAPTSIAPGRWRAAAHYDFVSDVIVNDQPPEHGPIFSCAQEFTVADTTTSVRVTVTFNDQSCQIEVTAT